MASSARLLGPHGELRWRLWAAEVAGARVGFGSLQKMVGVNFSVSPLFQSPGLLQEDRGMDARRSGSGGGASPPGRHKTQTAQNPGENQHILAAHSASCPLHQ